MFQALTTSLKPPKKSSHTLPGCVCVCVDSQDAQRALRIFPVDKCVLCDLQTKQSVKETETHKVGVKEIRPGQCSEGGERPWIVARRGEQTSRAHR